MEKPVKLRVEFHCHTVYSKDSLTTPQKLVETCRRKGIDRVVVTDHNQIEGAMRAKEIDPERVIVGEEIMTTRGELLAAYVTRRVPKHLEPRAAIEMLREQGAFISVSHPFDTRRSGAWKLADLAEITPLVDAVEVFNSRCLEPGPNQKALAYASVNGLCGTAGSDAHVVSELGTASLIAPYFDDPVSLKDALASAEINGRLSPGWVHFLSFHARMWKLAFGIRPPGLDEG